MKLIFYLEFYKSKQNRKFEVLFLLLFFFECGSVKSQCFEVFILNAWSFDIMASKRNLRSYFGKSSHAKVKRSTQKDKPKASHHIQSVSIITGETEIQLMQQEEKRQVSKSYHENNPLKSKARD